MIRFLSLLLVGLPAYSQLFSIGVKGGVPMTNAYSTFGSGSGAAVAYDRRYIVGPTVEVPFPYHLSFEVDALYRRNGFDIYSGGFGFGTPAFVPPSVYRTAVNEWQFPLLVKYDVGSGRLRPFVDGGLRICAPGYFALLTISALRRVRERKRFNYRIRIGNG
jgi:hypothetical protein